MQERLDIDAEPEPKKVIQSLHREQIKFPIIPLSKEREKQSLQIKIVDVTSTDAKINVTKPDTDYQVSYFFKKNDCWKLERIEDRSL